ncbi:MAG: GerMN domain-containing protein [Oscillatoria sp. PMC 1051.18]|uniref:GerMN domain-containing protein n=1 Tax=Oscillatoria salina TaxID=331517 RepID=UPI0013BC2A1F|nr:GerMN domain-containing protein [Oscillatoria salina]MBZ8180410.1 spore germination protein [Oscillatoria salina IIICB1]MEC4893313.1 GerMN domain-containing protein [Oscillatoria sp. PMC 1050.18]MEC5028691.1 GerMN domain-containing protein [Oscillatoria sp. PMC 1051.18]NET89036.1 spore germination protein [Kamptonema sp. SIO1D9]
MQNQEKNRRVGLGVIAGVSAAVVIAVAGGGWWAWHSLRTSSPPASSPTEQAPTSVRQTETQKAEVYWIGATSNDIEVVPNAITIENTAQPEQILESAFKRLLAGPSDKNFSTTIPDGTTLRSLTLENDGVHVNLSEEFTTGGGTASMTGRVAQVIYTATSLDPNAQVWIEVEGKTLEVLGGEGLLLDQPLTRKGFEKDFDL